MKILVTGGTGVVGGSTVTALLRHGHDVRLLSRNAERDAEAWSKGVEAWVGDVADPHAIGGASEGCGAVIHIAGIVDESPPDVTFERVNVGGTRNVLHDAERAGARRFIFVSSLGAEAGRSPYHASKRNAEALVRAFTGEWLIVRPGAVYGPGDEHLSVLLRMVRALPVVPLIGGGDQRFQPVWHEDVGEALALSVDRADVANTVLNLAGVELTTLKDLTERISGLCGRSVVTMPIPSLAAEWGLTMLDVMGVDGPISESQLQMLAEENIIQPGDANCLVDVFGITPTPLSVGLGRFINEQPEHPISAGVGPLQRKRFRADIRPASLNAPMLFAHVRANLGDLLQEVVRNDPRGSLRVGTTLTLHLPVRGSVQVRVAEAADGVITLLTIEGHPLAGAVRFVTTAIDGGVRFEVVEYDRGANVADLVAMRTVGGPIQSAAWGQFIRSVARVAGDAEPTLLSESETLSGRDAELVEQWANELAMSLKRHRHDVQLDATDPGDRAPATP